VQINVVVSLQHGDSFAYTADAAAAQVIAALGANPTKDYCSCTVVQNDVGEAGTQPPPPVTLAEVTPP